jgi:pimeloyl-ACP methyl ester carboxylesterase
MRRTLVLAPLAALLLAAPARADTTVAIKGAPAPGPAKYDRVYVTKIGPASARKVLVLVPGTNGGAGDFTLVGHDLVQRVPGLQVWAMDRREQALEDTSVFRDALAGTRTPQQALDYYLGWISDPSIQPHYQPLEKAKFAFMDEWGLKVQIDDLRRVIQAARRGGRTVILGGHSLGGSVTVAYASWDFGGHPGYKDIAGMVCIDGGLLGTFNHAGLKKTRQRIAALKGQGPWLDLLGVGLPWATGAFAELGGLAALADPTGPSVGQSFPLLPAAFKPPIPATNRGELGYALDDSTSPKALALIHVRAGHLGANGDWVDGEVSPIERVARLFAQEPANAVDWYYPARLNIDVDAASSVTRNAETTALGLRVFDRRQVDVPLYAFQTSLTHGGVLRGARAFIRGSRIPRGRSVLVDASRTTSHLDPLTAAPATNEFLKTVVPFLKRLP